MRFKIMLSVSLILISVATVVAWGYRAVLLLPDGGRPLIWAAEFTQSPRIAIRTSYYAIGVWPLSAEGSPVRFAMPYRMGPPKRFVDRIHLKLWPGVEIQFRGPHSPEPKPSRDEVSRCWHENAPLSCALDRVRFLRHSDLLHWGDAFEARWVEIRNPALSSRQMVAGIAFTSSRSEHFVLITDAGIQQTFSLIHEGGELGLRAREVFQSLIRSLRVSDDLGASQAWAEKELLALKVQTDNPLELARVQSALLAEISARPGVLDPYYHLARISVVALRNHLRDPAWSSIVESNRALLSDLSRYASDVARTGDPRVAEMQQLWLEAQKLTGH